MTDDGFRLAVVVSAVGGRPKTTDLLLSTVEASANRDVERTEALLQRLGQIPPRVLSWQSC